MLINIWSSSITYRPSRSAFDILWWYFVSIKRDFESQTFTFYHVSDALYIACRKSFTVFINFTCSLLLPSPSLSLSHFLSLFFFFLFLCLRQSSIWISLRLSLLPMLVFLSFFLLSVSHATMYSNRRTISECLSISHFLLTTMEHCGNGLSRSNQR